jgi:uncharacterized membrane protein/protein-disulfide isomerase
MTRHSTQASVSTTAAPPPRVSGLVIAALVGLGFAVSSTWVHYRILHDPFYSSACDVNATFSCSEAYTSRFGSIAGVPVALIGVVYFSFILALIAICRRSAAAAENLGGYVFAASTLGLAGALYLAYASFFILKAVCLLCVGSYAAIIALFLISGAATRYPMTSLPGRAARDLRTLVRTPAALTAAVGFIAAAVLAIVFFPGEPIAASQNTAATTPAPGTFSAPPTPSASQVPAAALQKLEELVTKGPRVPILVPNEGAAVVIVKFNDYQCPPCRQTYMEYKPVLAKLQQQYPGKILFVTRDFPLETECNTANVGHQSACEAAVAVRLAREKGKGEAMEEWLFANQPQLTPALVKSGVQQVAGVTNFDERYQSTLQLVKGDIAQGQQFQVNGTPTFFMNGLRLPNLRGEFFESAVLLELRRLGAIK